MASDAGQTPAGQEVVCGACDGQGWYLDDCHDIDVETGQKVYFQRQETCGRCDGRGWVVFGEEEEEQE